MRTSCLAGLLLALAAAAVAAPVEVTLEVTPPVGTPGRLYVALSSDGWAPDRHPLQALPGGRHRIVLALEPGTRLAFKLTRGSWASVEKGPSGAERANRVHLVRGQATLRIRVAAWAGLAGDVQRTTVPGFAGGRAVWVYRPPGFDVRRRYPLLVLLDGQNVFDPQSSFNGEWRVDETCEAQIRAGELPPLVVVAVENAGAGRRAEYTPSRGGAAFARALATALVPHARRTWNAGHAPQQTAIGGSSLGGLLALHALRAHPEVFGGAAALSPSLWLERPAGPRAGRLYLDVGAREAPGAVDRVRALQASLRGARLQVVVDPEGRHRERDWARRLPGALRFLFPPADGVNPGG